MKTTKMFWHYALALIAAALIIFSNCKKEGEKNVPYLTTTEVTDISQTTATSGGNITDDGGATVTARGVCWSTSQNPTINDSKTEDGTGAGSFTSSISGLESNTTYYVRAYATNGVGTSYGSAMSFTTLEAIDLPTLTTTEATEITQTTASSGGNITDDGGATVTARGVCWSTSQTPTTSDSKTEDGTGAGSFTSSISGLEPNTTYYLRAYATNSAGTVYGSAMSFRTLEEGIPVDANGNVYTTVIIGNQEWFAENLRTTKYNDGTNIPTGHSNDEWSNLSTGAYAVYSHSQIDGLNSDAEVLEAYGALYNWYAIETGNLCPTGWHVPTDEEWTTLTDYSDGGGCKLKSTRTAPDAHPRWDSPNTCATDEYGFSALPGGGCDYGGHFYNMGNSSRWWSGTEVDGADALARGMYYGDGNVSRFPSIKRLGFSVRCVKEN